MSLCFHFLPRSGAESCCTDFAALKLRRGEGKKFYELRVCVDFNSFGVANRERRRHCCCSVFKRRRDVYSGKLLGGAAPLPRTCTMGNAARILVMDRLGPLPNAAQPGFHRRRRQRLPKSVQAQVSVMDRLGALPPFQKGDRKEKRASVPLRVLPPFNAERHRQKWTWVRPSDCSDMEIDESSESVPVQVMDHRKLDL